MNLHLNSCEFGFVCCIIRTYFLGLRSSPSWKHIIIWVFEYEFHGIENKAIWLSFCGEWVSVNLDLYFNICEQSCGRCKRIGWEKGDQETDWAQWKLTILMKYEWLWHHFVIAPISYQQQLAVCSPVRLMDLQDVNRQVPLPSPPKTIPPVLVMGGTRDVVVDVEAIEETAGYFSVKPLLLDVAHDCMLDTSWEKVASALHSWLESLSRWTNCSESPRQCNTCAIWFIYTDILFYWIFENWAGPFFLILEHFPWRFGGQFTNMSGWFFVRKWKKN